MLYTPQSLWKEGETYGTLQLPGINGGANWSGSGADPETGFLYVPSRSGLHDDGAGRRAGSSFTDFPYVPNGKLGPESYHPAKPPPAERPAGTAADQAAVQPHDRVRFESRRDRVAGPNGPRTGRRSQSSGVEGRDAAAARRTGRRRRTARHQDAADLRPDSNFRPRRRTGSSSRTTSDRRDTRGGDVARHATRDADDLSGGRPAVRGAHHSRRQADLPCSAESR